MPLFSRRLMPGVYHFFPTRAPSALAQWQGSADYLEKRSAEVIELEWEVLAAMAKFPEVQPQVSGLDEMGRRPSRARDRRLSGREVHTISVDSDGTCTAATTSTVAHRSSSQPGRGPRPAHRPPVGRPVRTSPDSAVPRRESRGSGPLPGASHSRVRLPHGPSPGKRPRRQWPGRPAWSMMSMFGSRYRK